MAYSGISSTMEASGRYDSKPSDRVMSFGAINAMSQKGTFRSRPGELLGTAKGNVAQRQGLLIGKDGQPMRTSATDAILYKQASVAGKYGFRSAYTNRFRQMNRSMGWRNMLTQSEGPNKAPHGVAQSSLDSTKERYSTEETRFGRGGVYDTNEKWDPGTKRFERSWSGFNELKINKSRQHYTLNAATMFKGKKKNVGAARRVQRMRL